MTNKRATASDEGGTAFPEGAKLSAPQEGWTCCTIGTTPVGRMRMTGPSKTQSGKYRVTVARSVASR